MISILVFLTWLDVLITTTAAGCTEQNNNYYCDQVDAITYTNFGLPGSYEAVSSMVNGQCSFSPQSYSGGMSPLNGEISWHFRGPIRLKQFAFYTPGTSAKLNNTFIHRRKTHHHGNRHWHSRKVVESHETSEIPGLEIRQDAIRRRRPQNMVTTTINGQVVSWSAGATTGVATASASIPYNTTVAPASTTSTVPYTNAGVGKWGRQGYYNAEQNSASGIVFLNNKGGQGSGVFDTTWGASLSYASADGLSGSSSAQILTDTLLPDDTEVAIFTSRICDATSCGTVRPGTVAYHGFDGASKLFLLEFSMPLSNTRNSFNADMPAAWILNAQIPRTMQYGDCSCWKSGCGEWDIFEVLDAGNSKCKSTFHGVRSGGDSDWFERPTGNTVKVAVWFDGLGNQGVISTLPDDAIFDESLDQAKLNGWLASVNSQMATDFMLPN